MSGGGEGAAGVGVVGQAAVHEQRAEVGVAEAERAVVVRVLGDLLGGVAGGVDDDFHRGGDDADGVAVGGDIELAAGGEELHQVEADARLQAESSRNMYSEQGLDALMRAVFLLVCQRLMVESYCMPGSPHCHVASAMWCMRSRARYFLTGRRP